MKTEKESKSERDESRKKHTKNKQNATAERRKRYSFIETACIAVLVVALIVLFAQYCLLKNVGNYGGLPKLDARHGDFAAYTSTAEKDDSFIFPAFIGVVSDGQKLAPSDLSTRSELVRTVRTYVLNLFSGNAYRPEFASESAKTAYIDRELYGSERCVYILFPSEVPSASIYPLLTGNSFVSSRESYSIRELFVFCSERGVISGAAVDSEGTVTVLTGAERTALTFDSLSAYLNNEGMTSFSFVSWENRRYAVYNGSVARPTLSVTIPEDDYLSSGSNRTAAVLQSFGFSPNNTRRYITRQSSSNASVTYVEDMGELQIDEKGNVRYWSPAGGGIPIALLCDRQTAVGSFEDKVCAAYHVLRKLDPQQFGGYASFCLTSASYADSRLTLRFSYTADGIVIRENENAAEFVFDNDSLVAASLLAHVYEAHEETYGDIPQRLLFAVSYAGAEEQVPPRDFAAVYTKDETDGIYRARYAFSYVSGNENAESESDNANAEMPDTDQATDMEVNVTTYANRNVPALRKENANAVDGKNTNVSKENGIESGNEIKIGIGNGKKKRAERNGKA